MNLFKRIITIVLILICTLGHSFAQQKQLESRWKKYINLKNYMQPFWTADTIHDEIIQIIKRDNQVEGTLLFSAAKVLSVRSADLYKSYKEGIDWTYNNGRLLLTPKSTIPFIDNDSLLFTVEKPNWSMKGKAPGTYVLFNEGNYFRSMQISVTYIPEKAQQWDGPLPLYADSTLPVTLSKLKNKIPLNIVFYGNSIETGANSSGFQNQAPYMPSWPELIIWQLRQSYGEQVQFDNQSVGGMLAQWGEDNASARVGRQKPDLVIIGFGMNDGTFNVPPDKYRQNIKAIIDKTRLEKPGAEFILIAPMLANPLAMQSSVQASYKVELDKLAKKGVVVADITGVHQALLKIKKYQDMTGNNVNHPNDYLARWYAQFIVSMLIDMK